jgi:hypothetical protein
LKPGHRPVRPASSHTLGQDHRFELPLPYSVKPAPPLPPPPVPQKQRHRSATSPPAPPLPPKPQLTPSNSPPLGLPNLPPKIPIYPQSISPKTIVPSGDGNAVESGTGADEDDLAAALALSASESGNQQKLLNQEEEDLARALAESVMSQKYERGFYSTSIDEAEIMSEEGFMVETMSTTTDDHSLISTSLSASSTAVARSRSVSYSPDAGPNLEPRQQGSLAPANQPSQARLSKTFDEIALARRLADKSRKLPPLASPEKTEHLVVPPLYSNAVFNTLIMPTHTVDNANPNPLYGSTVLETTSQQRLESEASTFTNGLTARAPLLQGVNDPSSTLVRAETWILFP